MNKTKKAVIGVGAALLALLTALTGFLLWRRATWRYPYSPETREVLSDRLDMIRLYGPTMETNICYSDAVLHVRVVSDGQKIDEMEFPDGTKQRVNFTDFRIKVLDILYGAADNEELTLRFAGQGEAIISKPHRNDELIVFVRKNQYHDHYTLTDLEASIFAVLPDNSLYSFEDMQQFSQYDGQPLEELYQDIIETAEGLGGVMPEHLAELPLEPGAVFQQLWRRATWRYPYSPETREVLSDRLDMIRLYSPTMETNICYSDAVLHVRVVSDGQKIDEMEFADGTKQRVNFTDFRIKVLDILYGAADNEELTLRFAGQEEAIISKPHRNDELIVFVRKNQYYDHYTLTDMEASIFAVLPDNSLYSFEDMQQFSQYDGQPLEELYQDIIETAEGLGGVMPEHLAELPLEPGAVFQQLAEEAAQAGGEPVSQRSLLEESDE